MLYNKNWDKKPDIHSLESLIAWLETMPSARRYDYVSSHHCLLSQYYTAMGWRDVSVGPCHVHHHDIRSDIPLSKDFHDVAIGIAQRTCHISQLETFGGALKRASYLQKENENA